MQLIIDIIIKRRKPPMKTQPLEWDLKKATIVEHSLMTALQKAEKEGQPVQELLQAVQDGAEIQVSVQMQNGAERLILSF